MFHHRYYRYVRYMLRRYPKMRRESFSAFGNRSTRAICGLKSEQAWIDNLKRLAGK